MVLSACDGKVHISTVDYQVPKAQLKIVLYTQFIYISYKGMGSQHVKTCSLYNLVKEEVFCCLWFFGGVVLGFFQFHWYFFSMALYLLPVNRLKFEVMCTHSLSPACLLQ